MNSAASSQVPRQPNVLACLLAGFDTAANHATLLLFPIALDLLIWLGPHLYLKTLLKRLFDEIDAFWAALPAQALPPGMENTSPWGGPEVASMVKDLQSIALERMNMMFALRTYPVGIPSIMAARLPVETPWGSTWSLDLPSLLAVAAAWLLLTLLGLAFAALFYQMVANSTASEKTPLDQIMRRWPRQTLQFLLFSLLWGVVTFIAGIPFSCLASLGLGALGNIAGIIFIGVLLVLLFPLLFTPHVIVLEDAPIVTAVLHSARLVRITLPLTSFMFFGVLLLSQVLDSLWRIPAENSWVILFAVGGHAFATTGMLAATFIYFRRANQWVQALWQSIPRN